ncbi:DgyrCDS7909 [Dimorphilus gyrociliatus]|uniref:DgyrCDS7909 n=1 Tax=Dimorphilus gyrociliatus TaxID=2664684 RepID=A0A7I8VSN7_9ANNE|nr:DgyrCDS7909 [Dimorphilus gyrociliatus]
MEDSTNIHVYGGSEGDVQNRVGGLSKILAFRNQKYNELKKRLLSKGELFVDPEFPANNKSMFYSKIDTRVEWKRPKELCKVPRLVVDGATTDDIHEGMYGSGWFASCCCALLTNQKMLYKVIPDCKKQEWTNDNEYAGIFKFNFWRLGKWYQVVIDDLLPTKNGKLLYCNSKSRNEFWASLCQKAYAKLYGDYETMHLSNPCNTLVDFTGGVAQSILFEDYNLSQDQYRHQLFRILLDANRNNALMTTLIECPQSEKLKISPNGLYKGFGYVITSVVESFVDKRLQDPLHTDTIYLIRLRNPLGNRDWKGRWCEQSREMSYLSQKDRDAMGILYNNESEFWMDLDDFLTNFTHVYINHFVNTSFLTTIKSYKETTFHSSWTHGAKGTKWDRSGGNEKHSSFLDNPQFLFEIAAVHEGATFSLEATDIRPDMSVGASIRAIGFHIMRVADNQKYRIHEKGETIVVTKYRRVRSVYLKSSLLRGRYILVPSTVEPNIVGKFLLRIYTASGMTPRELKIPVPEQLNCCTAPYNLATRVIIKEVDGLEIPDTSNARADNFITFIVVKSEKDRVQGVPTKAKELMRNSGKFNCKYDIRCLFYRRKVTEPIVIQILEHGTFRSTVIGEGRIDGRDINSEDMKKKKLDLISGEKQGFQPIPGHLIVEFCCNDDIQGY